MHKKQIVFGSIFALGVLSLSFFGSYFFLVSTNQPKTVSPFTNISRNIVNIITLIKEVVNDPKEFSKKLPGFYIVQSGSMQPSIKVGSVVVSKPYESYAIGDVITFQKIVGSGTMITHRIMNRSYPDGVDKPAVYLTSGDSNEDFDSGTITQDQIVGKVTLTVPYIGYIANFAKTPYGFMLLVIVPATIIIYEELKNLFREIGSGILGLYYRLKKKMRQGKTGTNVEILRAGSSNSGLAKMFLTKLAILLPVFGALFVFTGLASAFFSDKELSPGNVLQAGVWTSPTQITIPSVTPTPTPAQVADHIVISEVQINGANANQDFVELYNPTNSAVDLNGWQLRMKNSAGTDSSLVLIGAGESIPAHGFFLWASNKSNGFDTSVGADVTNDNTLSANNSLELEDGSDITIDQVGWGNVVGHYVEGTPFSTSPGSSASIERKAYTISTQATMEGGVDFTRGNGFDAGNNSTDFILRLVSQPQNSGSATETP